jgi:hypothetical protein
MSSILNLYPSPTSQCLNPSFAFKPIMDSVQVHTSGQGCRMGMHNKLESGELNRRTVACDMCYGLCNDGLNEDLRMRHAHILGFGKVETH